MSTARYVTCACWQVCNVSAMLPVHVDRYALSARCYLCMLTGMHCQRDVTCACWQVCTVSAMLPVHADMYALSARCYLCMLTGMHCQRDVTCACWQVCNVSAMLPVHADRYAMSALLPVHADRYAMSARCYLCMLTGMHCQRDVTCACWQVCSVSKQSVSGQNKLCWSVIN
jgi:hypothetical protein